MLGTAIAYPHFNNYLLLFSNIVTKMFKITKTIQYNETKNERNNYVSSQNYFPDEDHSQFKSIHIKETT